MKDSAKRRSVCGAVNTVQYFSLLPHNEVRLVVMHSPGDETWLLSYWVPRRDWLAIRRLVGKINKLAKGEVRGAFCRPRSRNKK